MVQVHFLVIWTLEHHLPKLEGGRSPFEVGHFYYTSQTFWKWEASVDEMQIKVHYTAENPCPTVYHKATIGFTIQHP